MLVLRSLSQQDGSNRQEKGSVVDGPGNPGAGLQDQHSSTLASSGISQVMRAELVFMLGWGCLGWLCRTVDERVSFLPSSPGKGKRKDEIISYTGAASICPPHPYNP